MPSEMEMQQALEERMKALLEHASQTKVAAALGVKRTTVWRWAHGLAVTPGAVTRVQALLRPDLPDTITFDTTKEASPSMTRRLLAGVIALEDRGGITSSELAAATEKAEAYESLAQATDARIAERLAPSQRTPASPAKDRAGAPKGGSQGSTQGKRKPASPP